MKTIAAVVGVAATLVALAIVVHPFARLGREDHRSTLSTGPSPPSVTPTASTEIVGASGLVIASSKHDVRLCGGPMALALTPGPPTCRQGVRVTGVDLSQLADAVTRGGVTWGQAYLAGTLEEGTLHVTDQGPPRPEPSGPELKDPPCPPPSGGWASATSENPPMQAIDAYEHGFPSDVISVAVFRPDGGTWVITIASIEPARTVGKLSADYPDQLCVVPSRYTLGEVHDAQAAATALLPSGGNDPYQVTGVGRTVGDDGQPVVQVDAISNTPQIDDALASQPPGLIRVVPWLRPVSGSQ
jgi:hypothetical protein